MTLPIPRPLLAIDGGVLAHLAIVAEDPYARAMEMIEELRERFDASRIVVAWDSGPSVRASWFPLYKAKRRERRKTDPEARERHEKVVSLIDGLRAALPAVGVEQASARGYEGDDVLWTLARTATDEHPVVLISNDHDLHPALCDSRVAMYVPGDDLPFWGDELEGREGLKPEEALPVACLMGCDTDEVEGLKGIGIKKALRLVRACEDIIELLECGESGADMIRAFVAGRDPKAIKFAEQAIAERSVVALTERLVRLYTVPLEIIPAKTDRATTTGKAERAA